MQVSVTIITILTAVAMAAPSPAQEAIRILQRSCDDTPNLNTKLICQAACATFCVCLQNIT